MAVVVLVLWLFTAGAGFYLLLSSSLGRARPAAPSSPPAPAVNSHSTSTTMAISLPSAARMYPARRRPQRSCVVSSFRKSRRHTMM